MDFEFNIICFMSQVRNFSAENNLPPKALLLIDNCSAHKPIELLKSEDGNIVAMFLPPNVTAILQPMDQNPIRLVKLGYRSKLLCNIVAQENIPVEDVLKTHTLSDTILMLKSVWDALPQGVLIKAWKKIKNWDEAEYENEDNIPLSELIEPNDVYNSTLQDVQLLLSKVGLNVEISMEEIEKWNEDAIVEEDEGVELFEIEDEDSEMERDIAKVSYTEAIGSMNTLIKWHEQSNDANHVAYLLNMRTDMVHNFLTKDKKQTSVTDFFKSTN